MFIQFPPFFKLSTFIEATLSSSKTEQGGGAVITPGNGLEENFIFICRD
jgi:hypothetical protein